ncbi:CatB-related O-acetyltransferase [Roseomonas sp. E05]|uniref:CatB-related O-acetyltransferase n=1 Tax=Roseomonas sp. E05 TaxID=3046310 RepID=UPI0024B979E9|nr:CatB-related O-acetyltransferase [Roseomonas sp. E05]MDJ0390415.1 CatB-related O-acetyltransferase [Roseomonas sp. E05]
MAQASFILTAEKEAWLADNRVYVNNAHTPRAVPLGARILIPDSARIERYVSILHPSFPQEIGSFSYTHSAGGEMRIGRYCSLAWNVSVMGGRHPVEWATTSPYRLPSAANIRAFRSLLEDTGKPLDGFESYNMWGPGPVIGNDVWIGQDVRLARGIRIGDGAVIAAGSIVSKDVEPYTIVGGVPARAIKQRFRDGLIAELLDLQWWRYAFTDLEGLDVKNPATFVAALRDRIGSGAVQPFNPPLFDPSAGAG